MSLLARTFALLALCLLPLSAQVTPCPVFADDGFNIGCCNLVTNPSIPNFGFVSLQSEYGCIRDCSLERRFRVQVRLGFNPTTLCDVATINADVVPLGGSGPRMSGLLLAKYSRTFITIDAAGNTRQVWRFLVNGDLRYNVLASGPMPCPTPPDATATASHFSGTIDYFCDTATPAIFSARYDLSHLPGCMSHASFTTVPQTGPQAHWDRSYHLVGPGPFNWNPTQAPDGQSNGEAIRNTRTSAAPFAWFCQGESEIARGEVRSLARICPCAPVVSLNTPWTDQALRGTALCNGSLQNFQSIPVPGFSGNGGLRALSLGTYADGVRVHTYFGVMQYTSPCSNSGPIHVVHGSATSYPGGFRSFHNLPIAQLNRTALDLGNALPLQAGLLNIGWGSLHLTTTVFQLNL